MSFFKHVQLHKYDLTDKGVSQACKDEIIADMGDAVVHLTDCLLYTSDAADDLLCVHYVPVQPRIHVTPPDAKSGRM